MYSPSTANEILAHELECLHLEEIGVKLAQNQTNSVCRLEEQLRGIVKRSGLTSLKVKEGMPTNTSTLVFIEANREVPKKTQCSICFEEIVVQISGTYNHFPEWEIACSNAHIFHEKCIHKWLTKNKGCPLCRETVVQQSPKVQTFQKKVNGDSARKIIEIFKYHDERHCTVYEGAEGLEYKVQKLYKDRRYVVEYSGLKGEETISSIKYKNNITFFFSGVGYEKYISEIRFPRSELMSGGASKFYKPSFRHGQRIEYVKDRQIHTYTKIGNIRISFNTDGLISEFTVEKRPEQTWKVVVKWNQERDDLQKKSKWKYTIAYIERTYKTDFPIVTITETIKKTGYRFDDYVLYRGQKEWKDFSHGETFQQAVSEFKNYLAQHTEIERTLNGLDLSDKKYFFDEYDESASNKSVDKCPDLHYILSPKN